MKQFYSYEDIMKMGEKIPKELLLEMLEMWHEAMRAILGDVNCGANTESACREQDRIYEAIESRLSDSGIDIHYENGKHDAVYNGSQWGQLQETK